MGDSYADGDPAGISHESMMEQIVKLDIQYYFGYINRRYTDQMIEIFDDCLQTLSQQRLIIRQFDAMKCDEIGEAVQRYKCDHSYRSTLKRRVLMCTVCKKKNWGPHPL